MKTASPDGMTGPDGISQSPLMRAHTHDGVMGKKRQNPSSRQDGEFCPSCGSVEFVERPGKGPHHAELACAGCGRHMRWLSSRPGLTELAVLWKNEGEGYGGKLGKAPTLPAGARLLLFKLKDPKQAGPVLKLCWAAPGSDAP